MRRFTDPADPLLKGGSSAWLGALWALSDGSVEQKIVENLIERKLALRTSTPSPWRSLQGCSLEGSCLQQTQKKQAQQGPERHQSLPQTVIEREKECAPCGRQPDTQQEPATN